MLTIFSIPKAFVGHTAVIQRNAINSWARLGSDVQVILMGDDEGVKEAADDIGCEFYGDLPRNEFGTPLLRPAFEAALAKARHDTLCYVNADIVLTPDILKGISRVSFKKYLMIGQRFDIDIEEALEFERSDWEKRLRERIASEGVLHGAYGSDYFVFVGNKELIDFPDFAVGRPGWDCWFIFHARKLGYPVIDATPSVMVVHQNHDYGHIPDESGGTTNGKDWSGPETEAHRALIGGREHYFTPKDATHRLLITGVQKRADPEFIRSWWYRLPVLHPRWARVIGVVDRILPARAKKWVVGLLERRA